MTNCLCPTRLDKYIAASCARERERVCVCVCVTAVVQPGALVLEELSCTQQICVFTIPDDNSSSFFLSYQAETEPEL